MDLNNVTLGQLTTALGVVAKASGTPTGMPDLYDEGGLFGRCDAEGTLINAIVGPSGLEKVLKWVGTDVQHNIIEMLTLADSSGFAQSSGCADCGKPQYKICHQVSCFARICQQTNEFQADGMGLKRTSNAPMRTMFGNVTASDGTTVLAMGSQIQDKFLMEVGLAGYNLRNRVHYEMWSGTGGTIGGYTSMTSLPMIINTGYGDVTVYGQACNALDSLLVNFGNAIVGQSGSPSLYQYVARVVRGLAYRARAGGFDWESANTVIVISHTLADCFFDAFACLYGQVCGDNSTSNGSGNPTINNSLEVARLRDEFRAGSFVRIDGRAYPVIIDNMLPYTQRSAGRLTLNCSDVYVLTLDINGRNVGRGEFQDFNKTFGPDAAWFQKMFGATPISVTDGGRYMTAPTTYGGFCFDARILVKPRLVFEMPWLSGRLQNVCCSQIAAYPDPTPGDGLYWIDGGVSNTPVQSLYGPCAQQTGSYGTSYYPR
jgi:hypothetical protein